jgi:hypothetical protein
MFAWDRRPAVVTGCGRTLDEPALRLLPGGGVR